jgi:hypothetical protein
MSISRKITGDASGGSGGSGKYVDDVFSTYLYEGDQTTSSRQIVNGIDLDDKGGLVWIKERSQDRFHFLYDTERGAGKWLNTNNADAEGTLSTEQLQSFNSDGFNLGDFYGVNETGEDFASWSFAKQEGFFDVVTYTGDSRSREIPHNLGVVPGMFIIKCTSAGSSDWQVWHKSANGGEARLVLNTANSQDTSNIELWWGDSQNYIAPTDTHITLGGQGAINLEGREYVAYLFADDAPMFGPDGDESIIKCGGFPGADQTIDLGWEPQYVLMKSATASSPWTVLDSMRGWTGSGVGGNQPLRPNESSAEIDNDGSLGGLTSTGFYVGNVGPSEYIYMAIRRPNKPAKEFEPDELFGLVSATAGKPWFEAGFPVDMAWRRKYDIDTGNQLSARLINESYLQTNSGDAATSSANRAFDFSNGWYDFSSDDAANISWMWRRAPGFFDVVTYTGGQGTDAQIPHNLGARPEMLWVKSLSDASEWCVWSESYENTDQMLILNRADALSTSYFGSMPEVMTDEVFQIGGNAVYMNGAGKNYIAYLWASVPGICDIGSYTGNGDYQDIDCGFTNGARFVLLKRTDSYGDWMYFDTLRGISNSNSPMLQLNTTAAQNTASFIRPFSGGFQVTANPTGIASATYIYIAIA